MKQVVFITPPSISHRTTEESLGIAYLTSILRAENIPVTIIDNWLCSSSYGETISILKNLEIGMIGISAYISSINEVKMLINKIKIHCSKSIPIIAGGFGPTFYPVEFLQAGVDYVVRGECESTITNLYHCLINGDDINSIPGLNYFDQYNQLTNTGLPTYVSDLNTLPLPARDTINYTLALKNPVHINTSRGCMANCLFCSVISFDRLQKSQTKWRHRSIANIVDEIEFLNQQYGVVNFKFVDDSFIEPPRDSKWTQDFASEIKKRNLSIKFRTQVRADRISDEIVSALSDVGWYATSVGVENWSSSALKRMNKTATVEENLKAIQLLKKYKVYTQMGMILFDHATTVIELHENLKMLKTLNWPVTKGIFTEMFASEGTPFMKLLRKRNLITGDLYGNLRYILNDNRAELAYHALKSWHKSHAKLHDHAINPISAPKSLPENGYKAYWEKCMELNRLDLVFFEHVMDAISQGANHNEIERLTVDFTSRCQPFHELSLLELKGLDQTFGLSYIAESNKFLE